MFGMQCKLFLNQHKGKIMSKKHKKLIKSTLFCYSDSFEFNAGKLDVFLQKKSANFSGHSDVEILCSFGSVAVE